MNDWTSDYDFLSFPVFKPTDISNNVLWLKADRGITLNGSDVSDWADQSSEGNDASNSTASEQPAYSSSDSSLGNKPSVQFVGSTENLLAAFANATTQPFMAFVSFYQGGASGGSFGKVFHTPTAASLVQIFHNDFDNNINIESPTTISTASNSYSEPYGKLIVSALYDNTNGEIWGDGVSKVTGTVGTNVIATNGIYVGNRQDKARVLNGGVHEIVMYDKSLSTAEHNTLGQYMASEVGLTWTDI